MKQTKIIKIEGESKVVEFTSKGVLKRVILPVTSNNIRMGAPYGIPFAMLLKSQMGDRMATLLEDELHKRGIWTREDLESNPEAGRGAIQAAYGVDAQILLKLVKEA